MNENRLLFRYSPYWGRCETPYFHCLAVFDVWFWRQKSSNEKRKKCQDSRNKWNESGFRPPLCTYRLNWARRTSWGWWDDWDDTVLQTQDSKFGPWRSEAEHATSRSRRLPTILTFTRGWGRNNFVSFKPPRPTVAIATHPLSTMRINRSLGIFVIIFTQFSLVSQSILNRFSRNFAGTISWYNGNCSVNMTKFDEVP